MALKDEISAMNNAIEGVQATDAPGTTAPSTKAPATEAPTTEVHTTAAPSTNAPATKAPATKAPATTAPTTTAPGTEVPDDKDKIIEDLRKKLSEKETRKPAPATETPATIAEVDFIGEEDPEDVVRDKGAFNKLLNSIYAKGITEGRKVTSESILRSLPEVVAHNIEVISTMKKIKEEFYKANPDLEPFNKVVAVVFEETISKNPDKPYAELLKAVAPEVRKRLDLHKQTVGNKGTPPKLPSKKAGPGRGNEKPTVTPIQRELDDMNKSLGR